MNTVGLSIDTSKVQDGEELLLASQGSSKLLNFLTTHGKRMMDSESIMREFEMLTLDVLKTVNEHSPLYDTVVSHGWNGDHYAFAPSQAFDYQHFKHALATLYFVGRSTMQLKRKVHKNYSFAEYFSEKALVRSYCPNFIINDTVALYNEFGDMSVLIQEPRYKSFFGCCLLADISGFTKLSSAYCLKGSAGLDALHNATDTFLGNLVKTVYDHQGDGT